VIDTAHAAGADQREEVQGGKRRRHLRQRRRLGARLSWGLPRVGRGGGRRQDTARAQTGGGPRRNATGTVRTGAGRRGGVHTPDNWGVPGPGLPEMMRTGVPALTSRRPDDPSRACTVTDKNLLLGFAEDVRRPNRQNETS